jgi:hypothetical protein
MQMSGGDRGSYFPQDLYVLRRPFSLVLRSCKHAEYVKSILLSKGQYLRNIYFNGAVDKVQLTLDNDDINSMQKIISWALIVFKPLKKLLAFLESRNSPLVYLLSEMNPVYFHSQIILLPTHILLVHFNIVFFNKLELL